MRAAFKNVKQYMKASVIQVLFIMSYNLSYFVTTYKHFQATV